ncbi:MAG: lytic transglycosylase domain-containing protein [Actinobacteria bacterium]|nr:lytic transglycosylase domain-containing protein [Actinomycetota bacterium]
MKLLSAAVAMVFLVACSSAADDDVLGTLVTASPSPSKTSEPQPTPARGRLVSFPHPDKRVPIRPDRLAEQVHATELKLKKAIGMWLERGGWMRSPAGRRVALGALWQQRMYRALTKKPDLATAVIRKVPRWLARKIDAHVQAAAGLSALASPIEPPVRMRVTPVDPHHKLQRFYRKAGRRYDIPVEILASLNFVESKFGRFMGPSSAGALGPMQFMPGTWAIYGEGNVWNPHDAIMAAARYLSASGAPERMNDALFAYNRSWAYVRAIRTYADEMKKRPHSFYSYLFWQVFVKTTKGDMQLTGPGRDA